LGLGYHCGDGSPKHGALGEAISEPLDVLLQQGYAKKAFAETREAYMAEIVGA
jgi:hypothetical protein